MKKIMNRPSDFVDQSLNGILEAYPEKLKSAPGNIRAIARADAPVAGKVAIVTGGGYGHLPLFLGYVGEGLCDGCAVGNVFTSPSCESIMDVSRLVDSGKGILYLFGNYMGDQMNFEMASDMLSIEGIETAIIRASDDVASAKRENWTDRRGIAGILFAYMVAGSLARSGFSLSDVEAKTREACAQIATFGVSFSSCQLPEAGSPVFGISDSEMELGMGIHGEKGVKRCSMMTADDLAECMLDRVYNDLDIKAGEKVAVLINGLGSTSLEELYILFGAVKALLTERNVSIVKSFVGEYVTSMEMAGASLSLFRLNEETEKMLDEEHSTPFVKY